MNNNFEKWLQLEILANNVLEERRNDPEEKFFKIEKFISVSEKRIIDVAKKTFEGKDVRVEGKQDLFGLIESDIVLRIGGGSEAGGGGGGDQDGSSVRGSDVSGGGSGGGGSGVIVDIEIGGVYYLPNKRRSYTQLRDRYLASKGVVVERIDLVHMRKIKDNGLSAWLIERVEKHMR